MAKAPGSSPGASGFPAGADRHFGRLLHLPGQAVRLDPIFTPGIRSRGGDHVGAHHGDPQLVRLVDPLEKVLGIPHLLLTKDRGACGNQSLSA
jgi:hypothetical protein